VSRNATAFPLIIIIIIIITLSSAVCTYRPWAQVADGTRYDHELPTSVMLRT